MPDTLTSILRRLPGGPRVFLRSPTAADQREFLSLNRVSARFYRGVATPMTDSRAFAAYVARSRRPDFVGLLVCRRQDGAIVGCVNLSQIVRGTFQSASMGYQVFAPFAGQRYMSDALPLVLRVVFSLLRLHRVEANIQPTNAASISLITRAGFTREGYSPRYLKIAGQWRDHERWAMTVETWTELQRRRRSG
jgi:ribosomal-protein-alanine N-acetyltransferase